MRPSDITTMRSEAVSSSESSEEMTSTALPRAARSRTSVMISAFEPMSTPAGRLVEHEDVRLGVQPFADDDLLLVSARERADRRLARGRLDPQALDLPVGGFGWPWPTTRTATRRAGRGWKGTCWTRPSARARAPGAAGPPDTSAMPLAIASTRALDLDRRALDEDFARALWVDAEQHARQRATSAAEQARDADNFAGIEREIDRIPACAGR